MKYYKYIDEYSRTIYKEIYEYEKSVGRAGEFSNYFYKAYEEIFNIDMSSISNDDIRKYNVLINKVLEKIVIPTGIVGGGIFSSIILYFLLSIGRDWLIETLNIYNGSTEYIVVYIFWIFISISPTINSITISNQNKSIEKIILKYKNNASDILNVKVSEVKSMSLQEKLNEISSMYKDNLINIKEYEMLREKVINGL